MIKNKKPSKGRFEKHPEIDFFSGRIGGYEILTKQDKFKPLKNKEYYEKINGEYIKIDTSNLYQKKEINQSHKEFENELRTMFLGQVKGAKEYPIKKPQKVEVIISVDMNKNRLEKVDIDNLTKSILDSMNGIIFEDDSQVINILAQKNIHPLQPINGFMLGVRKVNIDNSNSWFKNVKLATAIEIYE